MPNKSKRPVLREDHPDSEHRTKKRRLSGDEEEAKNEEEKEEKSKASKMVGGLKSPNAAPGSHNKPAELFRKDLISAMKLADSEPLQNDDYLSISDPWRQEWEKGVQVPVNPDSLLNSQILSRKFLHDQKDEIYQQGIHEFTGMNQLAEQVVRYDLDDMDVCWLQRMNEEREEMGESFIHEWTMERIIEGLENQCHENLKAKQKTEEGLGIEYDEDIVCDVCRSPESEENNEMVFCDGCDICIHQACYGIQKIPEGNWLCRTCALNIKPTCILCAKSGGAMKSTRSGTKWAHVSCALWIPEVSIGCVEKMEPITKISQIPASRWALICNMCKERVGACIQCCVKTCKTAFHVTCAFQHNLEMKTILTESETDHDDGVKLKAYCLKHSRRRERGHSDSECDTPRKFCPKSPRKELSVEEKALRRKEMLAQMEQDFYAVIDVKSLAALLEIPSDVVNVVSIYWKLKRKTCFDKPMLTPKTEEADILEKQQEDSLVARMKMFVHLRQDLERVRNLCYMVVRREKTKRQYYRLREKVFESQVNVIVDKSIILSVRQIEKIQRKTYDGSIYDSTFDKSLCQVLPETLEKPPTVTFSKRLEQSDKDINKRQKNVEEKPREDLLKVVEEIQPVDSSDSKSLQKCELMDSTDIAKLTPESHTDVQVKTHHAEKPKNHRRALFDTFSDDSVNDSKENKPETVFISVADHVKQVKRTKTERDLISLEPKDQSLMKNQSVNNNETAIEDLVQPTRELRSAVVKEEKDFVHPVGKCVSQDIKKELNDLLLSSKLLVDNRLREKVETRFMKSRKSRLKLMNGFSDRSQRKLDTYFRKCDRLQDEDIVEIKSPHKNNRVNGKDVFNGEMQSTFKEILHQNGSGGKANFRSYKIPKKSNNKSPGRNSEISNDSYSNSNSMNVMSLNSERVLGEVQSPLRRISSRKLDNGLDFCLDDKGCGDMSRKKYNQSREASPDSTSSSLRSATSYKTAASFRSDSERILTSLTSPTD
ncbi:hypothetical protein ScPMuIL_011608 [Solemya velum]